MPSIWTVGSRINKALAKLKPSPYGKQSKESLEVRVAQIDKKAAGRFAVARKVTIQIVVRRLRKI